jgi:hypothetical protein
VTLKLHYYDEDTEDLDESDITQCEIMLQALKASRFLNVALLYSDDTYGSVFTNTMGEYLPE